MGELLIYVGIVLMIIGIILPKINKNRRDKEEDNSQPSYRQQYTPQPKPQPQPQPKPAPVEDRTKCPVCNRRNYLEDSSCKWCGTCFDSKGNIIPNVKFFHNHFRNIWDISNVVKYETLNDPLNMKFMNYIFNNFKDCQMETRVEVKTLIPTAPDYAMPFNFLLTKGDTKLAIVLVSQGKYRRYSLLETRELCRENNIKMLSFGIECENAEEYVVNRIRKTLEATDLEEEQSAPHPHNVEPEPQPVVDNNFNFRNIQDVSNVEKYETLNDPLNMKFMNYIFNNFKDCQMETRVEVKTLIPTAPDYAMPFNFLLTKGDTKLAIVLVSQGKYRRYSVLETRELCKENNIKMLSFGIESENAEEYVVNRIRQTLEA